MQMSLAGKIDAVYSILCRDNLYIAAGHLFEKGFSSSSLIPASRAESCCQDRAVTFAFYSYHRPAVTYSLFSGGHSPLLLLFFVFKR